MKYLAQSIFIGFCFLVFCNFLNVIWNMGYLARVYEENNHLYYVKKKTTKNGNIFEYPFANNIVKDAPKNEPN